ncbi:MAG: 50S ribosomal protein L21 [Patescibacteria group bacterium]|nr:50S ribosomal protein L21 [Patescibacteria group bacterium]
MNKIAVIKTGGKQYKVKVGEEIKIEKIDKKIGAKIMLDTLMVALTDGKDVDLGAPKIKNKVGGEIIEHGKDKKISVIKYKNKTRYLRNKGHRQPFTKLKITNIN